MADRLKRLARLYALYARMDWLLLTRDMRTGLIFILSDWISAVSSVLGIALLAVRFEGIGALSADEILWMLGFFTLADGATNMLGCNGNTLHISRRIGRGQVDHMLIQPLPMWMQLVTEGFLPFTGSSEFVLGLGLTIYATVRLAIPVTVGWLLTLALYALCRVAVAAGASYLAGSAAFWRPVACEELSSVVLDALNAAGKYPLAALPAWMQGLFLTALPVGLMAWLPSLVLLGRLNAPQAYVWPVAMAAGFLSAGGLFFRKGLKRYALYGCPRYKAMGHRN